MKIPKGFREVKAGEYITANCEWIGDEFTGKLIKPLKRPTKQPAKKGKV